MKTLEIKTLPVTIRVVEVGGRKMTKAVWRQVPVEGFWELDSIEDIEWRMGDKILPSKWEFWRRAGSGSKRDEDWPHLYYHPNGDMRLRIERQSKHAKFYRRQRFRDTAKSIEGWTAPLPIDQWRPRGRYECNTHVMTGIKPGATLLGKVLDGGWWFLWSLDGSLRKCEISRAPACRYRTPELSAVDSVEQLYIAT